MKNIRGKLIALFKEGFCTPQLSLIAKKINEPSTTIHYNIRKLENEGAIRTYKAVFDYAKIGEGFCAYVLINVSPSQYEHDWSKYETQIVKELAKNKEVESLDIITGDWDMILKIRTKDQSEFYEFLGKVVNRIAIQKSISLVSLRQVKSDFLLQQRSLTRP
jgi:Lrp/AsnC family leucine-responsive transcriptional regulator